MTVLRHRVLNSSGQPVVGKTASVALYDGNLYANSDAYTVRQKNPVTATSDSDGWIEWTLPPSGLGTKIRYSVVGIEDSPIIVAVPRTVSTALLSETRVKPASTTTPNPVTEDEASARGYGASAPVTGELKRVVSAAGAAQTIDLGAFSAFDLKASAASCAVTLVITGAKSDYSYAATLLLRQDATGGRAWTFPGSVTFAATPAWSTAANAVDTVTLLTTDGGVTYLGFGPSAPASSAPATVDTHFSYPHNAGYGSTLTPNDYHTAAVFIPVACTLTGIVVLNGDVVGGSVKVGLHSASGGALLASGSIGQGPIYQPTFVPFTSPIAVQPGKYHIGALLTSNTAKVEIATTFGAKMAGNVGGGNPPPNTVVAPLVNDWGTPPIMSTY